MARHFTILHDTFRIRRVRARSRECGRIPTTHQSPFEQISGFWDATVRRGRRRAAARGLVRVEVQAPKGDAGLIRALAETLRGGAEKAEALRSTLAKAVMNPEMRTAFDVLGSELPDEVFTGVFDQPRQRGWRRVDL